MAGAGGVRGPAVAQRHRQRGIELAVRRHRILDAVAAGAVIDFGRRVRAQAVAGGALRRRVAAGRGRQREEIAVAQPHADRLAAGDAGGRLGMAADQHDALAMAPARRLVASRPRAVDHRRETQQRNSGGRRRIGGGERPMRGGADWRPAPSAPPPKSRPRAGTPRRPGEVARTPKDERQNRWRTAQGHETSPRKMDRGAPAAIRRSLTLRYQRASRNGNGKANELVIAGAETLTVRPPPCAPARSEPAPSSQRTSRRTATTPPSCTRLYGPGSNAGEATPIWFSSTMRRSWSLVASQTSVSSSSE